MTEIKPGLIDEDPRQSLPAAEDPLVAQRDRGLPAPVILGGFTLAAVALFLVLNGRRDEAQARSLVTPISEAAPSQAAPPLQLPPEVAPPPMEAAPPAPVAAAPPSVVVPRDSSGDDRLRRLKAPAVVVDLSPAGPVVLAQADTAAPVPTGAASTPVPGQPSPADVSVEAASTQLRMGGGYSGAAIARPGGNLTYMVPQGAIVPAVLETAINSDLPGYARAVVSRDVYGFDARTVLIPRGSQLIGQYRSGVSLGQSRAFVIWNRLVRPDGVSVDIASPGTDELGRGGLTGDVNRHFFQRFSGSILLSVLGAGVNAIGGAPSTQIAIGSPGQAAAAASTMTLGDNIPPTIKVAQGEGIRIFVARDLDFSAVGPVR